MGGVWTRGHPNSVGRILSRNFYASKVIENYAGKIEYLLINKSTIYAQESGSRAGCLHLREFPWLRFFSFLFFFKKHCVVI